MNELKKLLEIIRDPSEVEKATGLPQFTIIDQHRGRMRELLLRGLGMENTACLFREIDRFRDELEQMFAPLP